MPGSRLRSTLREIRKRLGMHLIGSRRNPSAEGTPEDVARPRMIGRNIVLQGKYSYGFEYMQVFAWSGTDKVRIGSFNSIAKSEYLLGGNHRIDWLTTYPFGHLHTDRFPLGLINGTQGNPASKGDIVIQNDVWIGFGCTLLGGVTMGNGSVAAAHSVITKSVPDYAVVAGNPARVVKYRFEQKMIDLLLQIAWWDKDDEVINAIVPDLQRLATYEDVLALASRISHLERSLVTD